MAASQDSRKRKGLAAREESPAKDEFDGDALEGILSQSEDEPDVEESEAEAEEDEDEDEDEDEEDEEDEDEDEDEQQPESDGDGPAYRIVADANGGVRYEYDEIDPVYDSDDSDAQQPVNTIGNIPLSFYDSYPHIGYDINGKKILRPATGEALDALLDSIELPRGWTGLTDAETGKPLNLSQDELELLRRLQMAEVPDEGYDPYPDMVPYFTSVEETMPLSAAPEPKRRFVPSKHEAKRVAQLVRAIKDGRILPYKPRADDDDDADAAAADQGGATSYDIWADEEPREPHVMSIPAPKLAPPGYDLSYNPPPEYLPTAEERRAWEAAEAEERDKEYLPARFDALRKVPAYAALVKERFERCLDLYLAPRVRKKRLNVDPASLLPKLPRPDELRPFPTACQTIFRGHDGRVRSVAFSPDGEWVASGGDDGTVRVWALNGHQEWAARLSADDAVEAVRWRPTADTLVLAAAAGPDLFFMVPPLGSAAVDRASRAAVDAGFGRAAQPPPRPAAAAPWSRPGPRLEAAGVLVKATVRAPIKALSWHRRGDFVCSVSPAGQRSAVAVHALSRHLSQTPFRRLPGLAQAALFHPSKPLLLVATQRAVRCYDLQRQELAKVLQPGARWISSLDVHPAGDHVLVGSYDRRLLWHDLDLSSRPFKTMRFHAQAVRAVRYHRRLPLFADASDDGTLQVFHGAVASDLMESPTIVPVKMLRGHAVVDKLGVMDLDWHPRHPWCLSAGADGTCRLWA